MNLVQYSDPSVLREQIEPHLLVDEAVNNLFVGLLKNFSEHPARRQPTHFWFTVLFTDLDNPTSNSIYKNIGYKMIGRSKDIRFMQSFND